MTGYIRQATEVYSPNPRPHTFKTQNHGYYISVAQTQEHIHLKHRIMDIISVLPKPKNTYI